MKDRPKPPWPQVLKSCVRAAIEQSASLSKSDFAFRRLKVKSTFQIAFMNTKKILRLDVPLGEATRRATDFISRFISGGGAAGARTSVRFNVRFAGAWKNFCGSRPAGGPNPCCGAISLPIALPRLKRMNSLFLPGLNWFLAGEPACFLPNVFFTAAPASRC